MRHGSECAVISGVDSVLVQHEDVDVRTLGERVCAESGQVVTAQLYVAQRLRQTSRQRGQSTLGHVDVRQRGRTVEVQAVDLCQRIAAQHQVQQVMQVSQRAPLDVVDAIVCQEQIADSGEITERKLCQRREVVIPQVKPTDTQVQLAGINVYDCVY